MMIWIGWTLEGLLGDFVEGWGTMTVMTMAATTITKGTATTTGDDDIVMGMEI